ncbi:epoxide hydrolase family protein [Arthrobacter celericrescens]|uniref:epoxide hydrolase family protein n=1 Tax=Arthrobacter celericrescens TaxID=2320851 RepID=UPI000EA37F4F|nr:epoxide hydrolase family protein [Arthrobacter celericrescens]
METTAAEVSSSSIQQFRVSVPPAELDDLHERLDRTLWADQLPDSGSEYGVPVDRVQRLLAHWRHGFDWRAFEARINRYPQFITEIDGQKIHFLHVRSGKADATGLVLTHGWPGSIVEYLDVIDPLVAAGYDVVVPSTPGFGFSGPTTERGWDQYRVAKAWVELMSRLGYERYGAVGNDGGSIISPEVGRLDPTHVIGVHVTQLFSFPTGDPAELAGLTPEEEAALEHLNWFWQNMGAFNQLQSQSPQTLAHALADSPAGLLGWNSQLFGDDLDDDFIVANVAVYWFTRTMASSVRIYYEMAKSQERPAGPTVVPIALAAGGRDFQSIRRFAQRDHSNIAAWTVYPEHGHYAAHESPEAIAADIARFYGRLTAPSQDAEFAPDAPVGS